MPDGWHGVHATDANQGTRVIVHEDGKTAAESKKKGDKSDKSDDKNADKGEGKDKGDDGT